MQPSASRSDILIHCSYWLDPQLELPENTSSDASRYGSAFHEVMAFCLLKALKSGTKPSAYDNRVVKACSHWKLPKSVEGELAGHTWGSFKVLRGWLLGDNPWGIRWNEGRIEVETAYAIDVYDGKSRNISLPTEEEHHYPDLRTHEVAATLDFRSEFLNAHLNLDHKTGSSKDFSSPEEDNQIKTVSLIGDGDISIGAVLHADRQGLPIIYAAGIQLDDLNVHREQLKQSLDRVGDGSMRPGPWCKYCPAKSVCPTQYAELIPSAIAIVESATGIVVDKLPRDTAVTTANQVGKMHFLRTKMLHMMKKVDDEIHDWVRDHPREIATRPDGKHLEYLTREREELSKKVFIEVLGKVEAERVFEKLRKQGILVKTSREELHAVDD